ncbi:AAA domain-containing protein [Halogranum gelatinilyticum]|uniref:AAA domain-containing protein n=1 Tax=Halogranum gelatinilyticum TaxID=660521 RepID=A0A1G9YFZ6_9EURY|nr:AAA family ATPase [Halogranum gelatinilyticum]SDN08089.1 AAA domain-containing protein [Halogranum gelatinilyticum]
MTFDPDSITSGHSLIQRLDEYNPWWELGREASTSGEFSSLRSTFYRSYNALHEGEARLLSATGSDGVGKSRLLSQLIAAHIDPNFVEKFFRDSKSRELAQSNLIPPSNVLYIPLRDDPVFQLHPEEQLRAAVDHFETHVFRQHQSSTHYLFFDDLHVVERPNKRGNQEVGRWEQLLTELLDEHEERRIVFSGLSMEDVRKRLASVTVGGSNHTIPGNHFDVYPLGFGDFLRMRYRDIELAPASERFDEKSAMAAIQEGVIQATPDTIVSELISQESGSVIDSSTARREIANYCTTGGTVALRIAQEGISLNDDRFTDVIRSRGNVDFDSIQRRTLDDFRDDLIRAATYLGGVKDASGLERFCALAAHEHPIDDVSFDDLTAVLNIDRRTLRDKYLSNLSRLHLLSPAQEYDNQRPRKIRFYLRNPGITNAFCQNDLNDVLRRQPGLDEALAKAVTFDHTVRLSSELNHIHDPKRGVIKFWVGSKGTVDFVLKINGTPIPILWSYSRGLDELYHSTDTPGFDALQEFLDGEAYATERDRVDELLYTSVTNEFAEQRRKYVQQNEYAGRLDDDEALVYDSEPPFGIVLTNARDALEQGVYVIEAGSKPVIQIPLWTYLRLSR